MILHCELFCRLNSCVLYFYTASKVNNMLSMPVGRKCSESRFVQCKHLTCSAADAYFIKTFTISCRTLVSGKRNEKNAKLVRLFFSYTLSPLHPVISFKIHRDSPVKYVKCRLYFYLNIYSDNRAV